ncbi:MAG: NYN domain-containing protein [Elusimicrobiota bacterium]
MNNYAFIDSQNVNLSIKGMGWKLDFAKFRIYLKDKYDITKAFLFIGYVPEFQNLYTDLQKYGYIIVFKPTLKLPNGKVKGNVDAEMVLTAVTEINNYEKCLIVSADGDFYCLIRYLADKNKLLKLMIPDRNKYSSLLRKFSNYMVFMNDLKTKLEEK